MPSDPGTPTLDQLKVLLTVADAGSFAAAARKLNRAHVGRELHDRQSGSPARYLAVRLRIDAETAIDRRGTYRGGRGARRIARRGQTAGEGKGPAAGLEAEVHLVLDVMLPTERVADALTAFRSEFPTVPLRLHVEALGAVTQLVLDRVAAVGISGPLPGLTSMKALEKIGVGDVLLIPVAAPAHPLARPGKRKVGEVREHIQLVLTDRSPLTQSLDFAVASSRTWRLADLGSKHMLLKAGIGWGNMPKPMTQEDLDAGRLVQLDLPETGGGQYFFQAIYRTDTPPGPAASWLTARFQEQIGQSSASKQPVAR